MPPEADQPPLIDLGSDFDVEPSQPTQRRRLRDLRGVRLAWRGHDRPLRIRMAWWAIPLALVLLAVPASALPGRSPLAQVARIPIGGDASVMVSGGTVIVVDVHDGADEISVYSLRGSRLRWAKPLAMVAGTTGVRVIGDAVVASTATAPDHGVATEAFDLGTGRMLWHGTDSVIAVSAAGYVITQPALSSGASTVSEVGPGTGNVRWRLNVAAGCAISFGQDATGLATQLVEMCFRAATSLTRSVDAPTLHVVNLSSGLVSASRDLTYDTAEADFYLLPPQRLPSPELTIVGDLALVTHNNVPTPTIDAFDVSTLASEWTGMPITNIDSLSACGRQICLQSGAEESVIDPATGKAIPGANTPGVGSRARLVLVPVTSAAAAFTYVIPQVMTGINVSVPTASNGIAWIDLQRPTRGAATAALTGIQPIHGIGPRSCFTSAGYLICATARDQLTLWRLPAL